MRYKKLGKTGIDVSEMALGTWGIGGAGWDYHSDEEKEDAVIASIEEGINIIDTAPVYNFEYAEKFVGNVLSEHKLRDKTVIVTKCGIRQFDDKFVRNASRKNITEEFEHSLKNLKTEYVDILLLHWPDKNTSMEETFSTLADFKKEGKALHIGVSNFNVAQIMEAQQYCNIEVVQSQYSMVSRDSEPIMKWAHSNGIGVMTYGTLGGGILSGKYREITTFDKDDKRSNFYSYFREPEFSKIQKLLGELDLISRENGNVPLAQIALNWAASKEYVGTCIVGAQSRNNVIQNTDSFKWQFKSEEINYIDEVIAKYL